VLGKDGSALNYHKPHIERTRIGSESTLPSTARVLPGESLPGVWGGRRGKIWWDDVRLEPAGCQRRPPRRAPLRATSADGQIVYEEGRDFQDARDPSSA